MTFFNKKEEVIDIQMTQFGKAKLARGLFRPAYYAFFDDDILYDSQYGGFAESQSDTNQRVKDTIRTKTQHIFYGIETEFTNANRRIESVINSDAPTFEQVQQMLLEPIQPVKDKYYSLSSPLGNSIVGEQRSPRWNIKLLDSEIAGDIKYDIITISKVAQIPIEPIWTSSIGFRSRSGDEDLNEAELVLEGTDLTQGDQSAFIRLKRKRIIIEVSEENAELLQRKNFDIEVFKVLKDEKKDSDGNVIEPATLEPLRFMENNKKSLVVNNILTDSPHENASMRGSNLDNFDELMSRDVSPTDVEYYFDILFDEDIDADVLCRSLAKNGRRSDVFSDLQIICPEPMVNSVRPNIYRPEEYEDPCE